MVTTTKEEMLDLLYDKYQTLYDFLQELNHRLKPADRSEHDGVILNTELEIERVKDAYNLINLSTPIPFPSEEQVEALALATGALQRIVGMNKAISALIDAGLNLIKTWPTSKKGD